MVRRAVVDEQIASLILYTYTLGGNTREISRLLELDHDKVTDTILRATHLQALRDAGITEEEWKSWNDAQ